MESLLLDFLELFWIEKSKNLKEMGVEFHTKCNCWKINYFKTTKGRWL